MPQSEKVYCNNCKFFSTWKSRHSGDDVYNCRKKIQIKKKVYFIHPPDDDSGFTEIEDVSLSSNEFNDCQHYEKKETFLGRLRKLFKY
jgi:hypothetical protein